MSFMHNEYGPLDVVIKQIHEKVNGLKCTDYLFHVSVHSKPDSVQLDCSHTHVINKLNPLNKAQTTKIS